MILATWQIAQPAAPATVLSLIRCTEWGKTLSEPDFLSAVEYFDQKRLIWRTASGLYVVTPGGTAVASSVSHHSARDKARLFYLNRKRFEVGA